MKLFLFSVGILFLYGCGSVGPEVLERADDVSSHPSWASITKPAWESDGKKYFLGYVELDGDASSSGALNMSDEKALSEPMRALVDQFLDQNQIGEDLRKDSAVGRRLISATRGFRPPMPTLTIVKRYFEMVTADKLNRSLRAYSLAEISVPEFERAKREYFHRLAGNSEMKKILSDVGRRQIDKVLEPENSEAKKN